MNLVQRILILVAVLATDSAALTAEYSGSVFEVGSTGVRVAKVVTASPGWYAQTESTEAVMAAAGCSGGTVCGSITLTESAVYLGWSKISSSAANPDKDIKQRLGLDERTDTLHSGDVYSIAQGEDEFNFFHDFGAANTLGEALAIDAVGPCGWVPGVAAECTFGIGLLSIEPSGMASYLENTQAYYGASLLTKLGAVLSGRSLLIEPDASVVNAVNEWGDNCGAYFSSGRRVCRWCRRWHEELPVYDKACELRFIDTYNACVTLCLEGYLGDSCRRQCYNVFKRRPANHNSDPCFVVRPGWWVQYKECGAATGW